MRCVTCGLCVVQLIALAGCTLPQPKANHALYPIGIYGVKSANDFATIKAAGFNLVVGPAERSYLDAAQRDGLKVREVD